MRCNSRIIFLGLFLLCTAMLCIGYWMQYRMGLEPCPLCITQRVFIFLTGVTAALAAVHGPRATGTRVYAGIALLFSLTGSGFSGRHLWLQNLPEDLVPACGPGIDYLLENFPLSEALEILLRGSGECATVDWSFLGLSIPGWTLLGFMMMAASALFLLWQPRFQIK